MLKYFRGIGIFLIGIGCASSLSFSPAAQADALCPNIPKFQTQDSLVFFDATKAYANRWLRNFELARSRNQPDVAAYALIRHLLTQPAPMFLSWQERQLLMKLVRLMEMTEYAPLIQERRRFFRRFKQEVLSLITLLNFNPLFRKQAAWGVDYPKTARVAAMMNKTLVDMLWTLAPFALRLTPALWERLMLSNKAFDRWKQRLNSDEFWKHLGLTRDEFTNHMQSRIFREAADFRRINHVSRQGIFLRPLLWTMLLMALGVDPYGFVYEAWLSEPDYTFEDFIEDSQVATGVDLQGKNILVLVDEAFITRILGILKKYDWFVQDPIEGIYQLREIKSQAGVFQGVTVGSIAALNQELQKATTPDIIFIIAHGYPGDLVIGNEFLRENLDKLQAAPLKKDVLLVFISCNFGQAAFPSLSPESETWIQFAKRVLPDTQGSAIAPINPITFNPRIYRDNIEFREVWEFTQWHFHHLLKQSFVPSLLSSVGLKQLIFYFLYQDAHNRLYGNAVGFRLFDIQADRVYFFRSR